MCVFHKFMYSAFEQALSMKRALYKFGIIIIKNVYYNVGIKTPFTYICAI